jgi:AraC-like DNA-binding protein
VVAELGFTDNAHLCREFKKMCGTTPQSHAPSYTQVAEAAADRKGVSRSYSNVAFLQ